MHLIPSALTAFKATLSTQSKDLISKNKNSNETTLRKASVDTTTSPGASQVTVPKATAPSVGSETGPSPPGISAEGTSLLGQDRDRDRDARAYEHERQRAKHAGEWAKRRASKATGVGRAAVHAGRRAKSRKGGSDVEVDAFAVIPQGTDAESPTDGLGAGVLKRVSLPPNRDSGTDAVPGVKVNLSEIMVLSQRKLRPNVDDFEVIPHIRSVIALDDVDNVHDMDFDEPWEHIYGEEKVSDDRFGRPSYARVAGTGCQ